MSLPSATILALAALAAVIAALVLIASGARRSNEQDLSAERARVVAAVDGERRRTEEATARLAEDASAGLGTLQDAWRVDGGQADGPATRLGTTPTPDASFAAPLRDLARAARDTGRASAMLALAGDLADAAAQRVERPGSEQTVLGVRPVDPAYLAAVARAAGVQALRLERFADDQAAGAVAIVPAWAGFGLSWQPARPGDALMLDWTIVLVMVTASAAVLIVWRARQFAGELQSSAARAVAASNNDWLSGLPHRMVFNHMLERELEAAKRRQAKLALMYLDVDHFGAINDAFGLETGDRLIRALSERITAVIKDARLVARFEGDGFMILLPGVVGPEDCERLSAELQDAMKPAFDLDGTRVAATLSIGVALAPADVTERNELIRLANLALNRAKRDGRNRVAIYAPELDAEWRRQTNAERDLRAAIAHGGLALRYQPIVCARTGQAVAVEALVRWEHPEEGPIAPDRFIGLAEDRGLILPLGEWVLREACRAAVGWPGLRVAVNVSPIQFRQRDFVAMVHAVLEETGLDPSRLELELTEGVLVEHDPESLAAMADLRRRGIRLALDDFGTGYSSLIYLRRFAVDKIKIDRAFVDTLEPGTESAILVDAMAKLGRALGLTITVEGVETDDQRLFLAAVGCDQLQGYLISPPLREAEVSDFVAGCRASRVERAARPARLDALA